MRNRHRYALTAALALPLLTALPASRAAAQNVTGEGWTELSAGREFYIEVPMIDSNKRDRGVGVDITAESMTNNVRYAADNPDIRHVVFKMATGGGSLMHAEAMAHVIEQFHEKAEFHIVIDYCISAGIWTAFSCDSIFILDKGTIGGATAYRHLADGTVKESDDIPQIAARMALTAERNGHDGVVIAPLMHLPAELHFWRDDDGGVVLSATAPEDPGSLRDYKQLDNKDTVLTLTQRQAIDIGLARPIAAFDASLVGEQIGVVGWTRANRYGRVTDEIAQLYNKTRAMEDHWVMLKLNTIESYPITPQNRDAPFIRDMLEDRSKHQDMIDALRRMNQALNTLPDCHPERHIYLAGEDGQTILADPEAWQDDARQSRLYAAQITAALRELETAFRRNEIDQGNLEEIQDPARRIVARINGIANSGNAAYWAKEGD